MNEGGGCHHNIEGHEREEGLEEGTRSEELHEEILDVLLTARMHFDGELTA